MIATMSFLQLGSKTQMLAITPIQNSIILVLKAVSRCRFGEIKDGYMDLTPVAGFNGIADISWVGGCPR